MESVKKLAIFKENREFHGQIISKLEIAGEIGGEAKSWVSNCHMDNLLSPMHCRQHEPQANLIFLNSNKDKTSCDEQ